MDLSRPCKIGPDVCLFCTVRDFAKRELPTFGRLADSLHELRALADSVPEQWVEQQLRAGRTIVLFDEIDEVTNTKRQEASEWLERLLHLYPATIAIVAVAPVG